MLIAAAVCVSAAIYVVRLNASEAKKNKSLEPILGVVYQKQNKE